MDNKLLLWERGANGLTRSTQLNPLNKTGAEEKKSNFSQGRATYVDINVVNWHH